MSDDSWAAAYTQSALDFIQNEVSSRRVAQKLFVYRQMLQESPDLGRSYDPEYPAARPPFPCRCAPVPDTPFSLYYLKEEDEHRITIFCIEHQRVNPQARFAGIDWTFVE